MSLKIVLAVSVLHLLQTLSAQVTLPSNLFALSPKPNLGADLTYSPATIDSKFDVGHSFQLLDTSINKPLIINDISGDGLHRGRWLKASIVPASLVVLGTVALLPEKYCLLSKYTIHDKVINIFPGFSTQIDNYLQFAPVAAVFALKAVGTKSRSNFVNQAVITAKAELLTNLIVHGMKSLIPSERPYGGAKSMPSGHTAQAFLSATILDMEYRDTSPWISVGGYAVATATGFLRMVNNKHWVSDVLVGAGIGIFSTKVVYFTHKYRWGKKNNMVILPAIYQNGGGVSFAMQL